MAPLSLLQMLDVAVGTTKVGAVSFLALHRLLRAMLGYLRMQGLPTLEQGHDLTPLPTEEHPSKEGRQARDLATGYELLAPRKDPQQISFIAASPFQS